MPWGGGGGAGTPGQIISGTVSAYADLPDASSSSGYIYQVTTATGFLWNRRPGLYKSDGASWTRLSNVSFQVQDNESIMVDNSDNTKKMDWELSSVPTSTTVTVTAPAKDLDLNVLLNDAGTKYTINGGNAASTYT